MTITDPQAGPGSAARGGLAGPLAACQVTVLTDRCAGCQECLVRCPTGAISLDASQWVVSVDDAACVGCRQCERTCPFSAIAVSGPARVAPRATMATRHPDLLIGDTGETRQAITTWDEALAEAGRCLRCPDPTCVRGCPAHNDIPGFIAALAERDLRGAHEVLARTTVLPDVCSRVCDQSSQCEGACSWSLAGAPPVAIGALERFIAEHEPVPDPEPSAGEEGRGLSVAVIGAGPAGAAAAWDLIRAGAQVTIYERDPQPGGLMSWGIPDFTLPEQAAQRVYGQLAAAGVELRHGTEIEPGDLDGLLAEHDAVLVAVGASAPLRLPVPGADLAGVTDATSFLKRAKAALDGGEVGQLFPELTPGRSGPPRVVVIGGGNTAMDVARSARRLGMTATCVEWLDRRFAPVRPDELAEAEAEGVSVRFLTTLTRLEGTGGQVSGALLARTRQDRADRRPSVLAGEQELCPADLVVMAMGYRVDAAYAGALPGAPVPRTASGVPDRRWMASGILRGAAAAGARQSVGALALGREEGLLAAVLPFRERLFAAGDALVGPSTVVEAMAQGRRAAGAIIAMRPRRPGRPSAGPPRVLVCFESRSGTTAEAARLIAGSLAERGASVRSAPLSQVGPADLAAADLVIVGSWVEGLVLGGVRPARAARAWLSGLPRLAGKPVAVFCTYAVAPKGALAQMTAALTAAGGQVVAQGAVSRRAVEREALAFAAGPLAAAVGASGPGRGRSA